MPKLVRMYIRHVAIGFALSAVFTSALLYLNVANLWHLITHTQAGPLAAGLLFVFNGIVFAGVQFAIAVTHMGHNDQNTGTPKRLMPKTPLVKGDTKRHQGDGPTQTVEVCISREPGLTRWAPDT